MSDFFNKMKNYLDKGVEVSKDALLKAGEKVQDFGDKSVNRIEISQLENKIQKEILKLGQFAYNSFTKENCQTICVENENVEKILKEIAFLNEEIEQKKALLKDLSKEKEENSSTNVSKNANFSASEDAEIIEKEDLDE